MSDAQRGGTELATGSGRAVGPQTPEEVVAYLRERERVDQECVEALEARVATESSRADVAEWAYDTLVSRLREWATAKDAALTAHLVATMDADIGLWEAHERGKHLGLAQAAKEVLAALDPRERLEEIRRKNAEGDLMPPDLGDDADDPPAL